MNSGQQSVSLSGIDDGDCVAQGLSLSTATANASLIPTPTYYYTSPNSTGTLYFTPALNQVGNVQLTATITDNAANSYGSALFISRNFNVYVNDYPTTPGAFTQPTGDKLMIDELYDIAWGASTDQTASVTYYLQYMLNGGSWTWITTGTSTTSYPDWGGHQSVSLVGRTVQFRVMAYDGTYTSGYTYSSTYEISDNEPPVANNISYKRFYTDTQKLFSVNAASGVLSNDTDPDNDTPLYVADPRTNARLSYGYLTLNTDGSFTYTSDDGQKDINDTFTYYANDGQENSVSPATVTIEILTPRFTNANGTGIFSDPANWNCGYVPNIESLNIIIAANMQLQVDMDYTCKNLQFETGASFTCINGHKLTISGDVINRHGAVAIDVDSPIVVSTSISINNQ
jgi:VCBS repeat-containing protein